ADERPLSQDGALAMISKHLGATVELVDDTLPEHDVQSEWHVLVRLTGRRFNIPVSIWVERMRELPAEQLESMKAERVKWTIGLETMIDPNDALSDFLFLMRTMAKTFPTAPAILNVNTEIWHVREELDHSILPDDGIEPTSSILWACHVIASTLKPNADA